MTLTTDQRPRINQRLLAELANVSRSTVTRALAHDPRISPEVSRRIRKLARDHGYRPNAAARSIATQYNNCVGAVLCNRALTNGAYGRLLTVIETATRHAGMRLQLSVCDTTQLGDDELPPIFEEVGVDGVILMGDVSQWLLDKLRHWVMPTVLLGSQPEATGVHQVSGDPRQGGLLITRHLLSLGHRRVGLLIGPRTSALHRAYAEGYQQAMAEAGISTELMDRYTQECPTPDVIPPMHALLQRNPDLTALFCDTDIVAWYAVQYLRARGVSVPEQFSVAGAGGGDASLPAKLTSVDVGHEEMARSAVNLLIESTRSFRTGAKRIVVQPQVVIGQTAARPAGISSPISDR